MATDTGGLPGPLAPDAEEVADPLLGRNVAGKFVLEKQLGAGAMGAVYRARQTALDKVVAIKVMHGALAADPMFAGRFHREAKAASRLDHPNSIRILDYGQDTDGLLYIAMEYLDGKDLAHVIVRDWPLPTSRVVDLLSQALGAIAVAHDLGITHRDLKPENIMVLQRTTDDGVAIDVVKVCDFGIAKLVEPGDDAPQSVASPAAGRGRGKLTTAGLVIGTPAYMSPEQGRGEPIDGRSDLYSMGVILYHLLAGQLPFDAPTALGLVLKHQTDVPVPPSSLRPGVDPQLEAVCLKALAKAPGDRYQTARELRSAIRVGVEGGPAAPLSRDPRAAVSVVLPEQAPEAVYAKTELQLTPAPTAPATVLTPPAQEAVEAVPLPGGPSRRWPIAAGMSVLAMVVGTVGWQAWQGQHGARVAMAGLEPAPRDAVRTEGVVAAAAPPTVVAPTVAPAPEPAPDPAPDREERPPLREPAGHRSPPANLPTQAAAHANGAPEPTRQVVASTPVQEPPKVETAPKVAAALPVVPETPPVPVPPAPPPVAPAAPAYDAARATVEIGEPSHLEEVGASGVNVLMAHAKGEILRCYQKGLPGLAGAVAGADTLHIETNDDGMVSRSAVSGPVGEPVASCVAAAVRGGRVAGADTGVARADIPLEFKAR